MHTRANRPRAVSRFDGRFRFLVALVPVRDLCVYAKHLFIAAIGRRGPLQPDRGAAQYTGCNLNNVSRANSPNAFRTVPSIRPEMLCSPKGAGQRLEFLRQAFVAGALHVNEAFRRDDILCEGPNPDHCVAP